MVVFDSGWGSIARDAQKKYFEKKLNDGESFTQEDKRIAEMYDLVIDIVKKTISFKE